MSFGETFQAARNEYRCDRCCQWIETGERYRRWLWKVAPRRVHVMREHLECPPDEFRKELEDEWHTNEHHSLPLAA